MTNMILTPNQTQGKCPEDVKFEENWCKTVGDCEPTLAVVKNGNGIRTGACVDSDKQPSIKSLRDIWVVPNRKYNAADAWIQF